MTKAAKATQKCARQSFSVLRTDIPSVGSRLELVLRHDLHCRPHFAVSQPAIFVAGHKQVAGLFEDRVYLRDIAGNDHSIDVSYGDQNAVAHVRTIVP